MEKVNLTDIPETMLWTLHNRASEAMRSDTYLDDPECIRIYTSIDYDYIRNFGKPDGSHPMRSHIFDEVMSSWLKEHPGGSVVELAAGLETQFQRIDDGEVQWYCVDVPGAIHLRETFLPETDRCRYIKKSALDLSWMDEINGNRGVFISAQGFFMYFEPDEVKRLFTAIVERYADVELMFDIIPEWFSKKTIKGYKKTRDYIAPPMPWGLNRNDIQKTIHSWSEKVRKIRIIPYGFDRGIGFLVLKVFSSLPVIQNIPPTIVHVHTGELKDEVIPFLDV